MRDTDPCNPDGEASIALALWADAWLRGVVAPDEVIEVMSAWADMHLVAADDEATAAVTGLACPRDTVGAGTVGILGMLRRLGAGLRLDPVLPTAGDVTGTTAGTRHAAAALAAGEALIVHRPVQGTDACADCIGLVPSRESDDVLRWTAYAAGCRGVRSPAPDFGEACGALRAAIRGSAELLGGMGRVGGDGAQARREVAWRVEDACVGPFPPGTSARVCDAFDSAATVAAIVAVVDDRTAGTPHSGSMSTARDAALRDLRSAVLGARRAAAAQALKEAGAVGNGTGTAGSAAAPRRHSGRAL